MDLSAVTNVFASIPTDWMIISAFAIFAAFDVLRAGARRVCTLALALPPAALLVGNLPNTIILGSIVGQFATPTLGAVLFFIVLAAMYVMISRIGLSWGSEAGQSLQAALAGVAIAALVVTLWIQTPALDSLWHFGPQVQNIFGEAYRFWWLIGAYAALAFVRSS